AANAAGQTNRIVAIADRGLARRGGKKRSAKAERGNLDTGDDGGPLFDPKTTVLSGDPAELLANVEVDLVSICTHTPSHVDLAIAALKAGKHVLVEKPVALSSKEVRRLARAAERSDKLCMPAMCIRFWPAWRWLWTAIQSGKYGAVRSATFRRLAPEPSWAKGFYSDTDASGGALFDLHVHDADFVRFCFGEPTSVSSCGTPNHLTTQYRFEKGPAHVVAEGGWDHAAGFEFEMNFTVVFEKATADFRLNREQNLVLWKGKRASYPKISAGNGYEGQVSHLLAAIRSGAKELDANMDDAYRLTRVLEAEKKSLSSGRPVRLAK
ncbi:MAG: putative dehydrogenase, partial [Planctomycetota bacterium]